MGVMVLETRKAALPIGTVGSADDYPDDYPGGARTGLFVAAIALGVALRLIAALWGDIGSGHDGEIRLYYAVQWAQRPHWQGLSGVWPPLHWYVLGALLRVWNEPIILAKAIGFACGIGTVWAMRPAVRHVFGDTAAVVTALLLAIFWTHIWLTSSYWVEPPYLLLVVLALHYSTGQLGRKSMGRAVLSGLFLAVAIMLRHEGMIVLGLFLGWYALNARSPRLILAFAALPLLASAWHFVEPWLSGHSYFDYAGQVGAMKAGENAAQGVGLKDALKQWVLIPAVAPSLLVVLPGLYGLWRWRRLIRRDLFAWLLIGHVAFYLTLTLHSGWRPQLRYIMLYLINLLPYAALAWVELTRQRRLARYGRPAILAGLVALTMLMQASGWWVGRNGRQAWGWLPLEVVTPPQHALDRWMATRALRGQTWMRVESITTATLSDAWDVSHSYLIDGIAPGVVETHEIYVPEHPEVLAGRLPPVAYAADVVLIDGQAAYYRPVLRSLMSRGPVRVVALQQHVTVLLVSPAARRHIGSA